ncbi:hypothetical protein J6590_077169 [Homalodisca vitripennis]|nr:hypothetical protein J6590_087223 [Homalodisca vitripennis]KAG8335092.1 hypothetical protein J6590_077169 [Homalodisca vitripennis]
MAAQPMTSSRGSIIGHKRSRISLGDDVKTRLSAESPAPKRDRAKRSYAKSAGVSLREETFLPEECRSLARRRDVSTRSVPESLARRDVPTRRVPESRSEKRRSYAKSARVSLGEETFLREEYQSLARRRDVPTRRVPESRSEKRRSYAKSAGVSQREETFLREECWSLGTRRDVPTRRVSESRSEKRRPYAKSAGVSERVDF